MKKSLAQVVSEKPFLDFADWWQMGDEFVTFMSNAICSEWIVLIGNDGDLATVKEYTETYLDTVFQRSAHPELVDEFYHRNFRQPPRSGEFDALSYAFYRHTFELIAAHESQYANSLERERRLYTKRVGKIFFDQVYEHLELDLPSGLDSKDDFAQLDAAIQNVGVFLKEQGYLRTHFDFRFDVDIEHGGRHIQQTKTELLSELKNGVAYALYEMGYPVILPSAVYLYHTMGEAQHHSSRTIEELFDRVGFDARETDDFDPIGYPSDLVVELWEIRKLE
ncbi:hypothetical protein KFU94_42255 [Chloroflexi bacterium TSY]|nr:hypothetical protein [Chloroflexi bacterium TSY]